MPQSDARCVVSTPNLSEGAESIGGQMRGDKNLLQCCVQRVIVQELCESGGGRPELSVLTSLLVSVDVKNY